jgi:excisionase family DNA binding protein
MHRSRVTYGDSSELSVFRKERAEFGEDSTMTPGKDLSSAFLNDIIEAVADRVSERLMRERGRENGASSRLLTLKGAAAYLSLSLSTIKNMLVASELRVVSRGGRRMIDIRDLDLWIERNKT